MAAAPLRIARKPVAIAGLACALGDFFPLQAASPLVFRLLLFLKISLPFCVGVAVSRHESSIWNFDE
jgi:hypothetical protein